MRNVRAWQAVILIYLTVNSDRPPHEKSLCDVDVRRPLVNGHARKRSHAKGSPLVAARGTAGAARSSKGKSRRVLLTTQSANWRSDCASASVAQP